MGLLNSAYESGEMLEQQLSSHQTLEMFVHITLNILCSGKKVM